MPIKSGRSREAVAGTVASSDLGHRTRDRTTEAILGDVEGGAGGGAGHLFGF